MDLINKGLQTTDGKCYLLTTDTLERLDIQFVPKSIDVQRSVDAPAFQIISRNLPRYQVTGGQERLKLQLEFIADEQSRSSVLMKTRWLKNLTYTDGNRNPAQRVQLIFGDMFKKELFIVESVDVSMNNFSKPHGFLPQMATVDLTLALDMDFNPSWDDMNPEYVQGTPDGQNPVVIESAEERQEVVEQYSNGNTFDEILRRVADQLRF
jgi:hypothetical protein